MRRWQWVAGLLPGRLAVLAVLAVSVMGGCRQGPGAEDDQAASASESSLASNVNSSTSVDLSVAASTTGLGPDPNSDQGRPTRQGVLQSIAGLVVAERNAPQPYRRARFDENWSDEDRDCHDTRAEVLLEEATSTVSFRPNGCTVDRGGWTDPWNGTSSPLASAFQIDHTVPLANAWVAGAWAWSDEKRRRFSNDLGDPDALVALEGSNNTTKGDKTPDRWKPELQASWCRYAAAWSRIKGAWSLTVTEAERAALADMAATCGPMDVAAAPSPPR